MGGKALMARVVPQNKDPSRYKASNCSEENLNQNILKIHCGSNALIHKTASRTSNKIALNVLASVIGLSHDRITLRWGRGRSGLRGAGLTNAWLEWRALFSSDTVTFLRSSNHSGFFGFRCYTMMKLARPAGIEPATLGFGGQYSIHWATGAFRTNQYVL